MLDYNAHRNINGIQWLIWILGKKMTGRYPWLFKAFDVASNRQQEIQFFSKTGGNPTGYL
jgi:hypothetical protein